MSYAALLDPADENSLDLPARERGEQKGPRLLSDVRFQNGRPVRHRISQTAVRRDSSLKVDDTQSKKKKRLSEKATSFLFLIFWVCLLANGF